jgi:hypothetical protein
MEQQLAKLFDQVVPAPSRHMGIPSTLLYICSRTRHCIYNYDKVCIDFKMLEVKVYIIFSGT